MSQQPEALKHAEWLERSLTIGAPEAAAELRRLHAVELEAIALRAQVERLQAAGQVAAPAMVELSEAQLTACLLQSSCIGTVKMSFESGPYEIDRPSINADRLCRAIESASAKLNGLSVGGSKTGAQITLPAPANRSGDRGKVEQPTYEQLSGALLSVGLASAFGEDERMAKLKKLRALRDKKDTWCGHAEISLRHDIDSILKEYGA